MGGVGMHPSAQGKSAQEVGDGNQRTPIKSQAQPCLSCSLTSAYMTAFACWIVGRWRWLLLLWTGRLSTHRLS
jgi:hypothetical protein